MTQAVHWLPRVVSGKESHQGGPLGLKYSPDVIAYHVTYTHTPFSPSPDPFRQAGDYTPITKRVEGLATVIVSHGTSLRFASKEIDRIHTLAGTNA